MGEVKAISAKQTECGKHVSDSKKRFTWTFQIDGRKYDLELINSTLSGKKTVLLNSEQIHHEKNLLNIDFEFTHMINGHSFRISRIPDNLNKFELRIDNLTFDQVRLGMNKAKKSSKDIDFSKKQTDPFADFEGFASSTKEVKENSSNNGFGEFDFDSFSKPSQPSSIGSSTNQPLQPKPSQQNIFNLLDANDSTTKQTANDFETKGAKQFQTNGNGFGDFAMNFQKNEKDLLEQDQNEFSTNAYANRNHYMDLQGSGINSEKYVKDGEAVQQEKKQTGFFGDFNEMAVEAGLATKKAFHNAAIYVNEKKKEVKKVTQSLI